MADPLSSARCLPSQRLTLLLHSCVHHLLHVTPSHTGHSTPRRPTTFTVPPTTPASSIPSTQRPTTPGTLGPSVSDSASLCLFSPAPSLSPSDLWPLPPPARPAVPPLPIRNITSFAPLLSPAIPALRTHYQSCGLCKPPTCCFSSSGTSKTRTRTGTAAT